MALISYEDLSAVLQSVKTKVDAVHEDLDTRISENEEVTSAALVDLNERLETVEQQGGGDISAELEDLTSRIEAVEQQIRDIKTQLDSFNLENISSLLDTAVQQSTDSICHADSAQ